MTSSRQDSYSLETHYPALGKHLSILIAQNGEALNIKQYSTLQSWLAAFLAQVESRGLKPVMIEMKESCPELDQASTNWVLIANCPYCEHTQEVKALKAGEQGQHNCEQCTHPFVYQVQE